MVQMDFMNATDARDLGMIQSLENADRNIEHWSRRAFQLLISFSAFQGSATFMAEDVRRYALAEGLEEPPSRRAWGGVIVRAAKMGLIESAGYAKTSNPSAHRTPAGLWKVSNVATV